MKTSAKGLLCAQVSLAELKQEVNAAKSLSTSASVVLQTNASLQDAQHKLLAPSPTVQSTRPDVKLEGAKQLPETDVAATCKGGPALAEKAPRPELLQWLATGVSLPTLHIHSDQNIAPDWGAQSQPRDTASVSRAEVLLLH